MKAQIVHGFSSNNRNSVKQEWGYFNRHNTDKFTFITKSIDRYDCIDVNCSCHGRGVRLWRYSDRKFSGLLMDKCEICCHRYCDFPVRKRKNKASKRKNDKIDIDNEEIEYGRRRKGWIPEQLIFQGFLSF